MHTRIAAGAGCSLVVSGRLSQHFLDDQAPWRLLVHRPGTVVLLGYAAPSGLFLPQPGDDGLGPCRPHPHAGDRQPAARRSETGAAACYCITCHFPR